ncbi:hypothetical protein [Nocardia sp. NPDC060249]|uniref:hypothetical protein n=1 Tax=Nocardia sp. NPDC060249 TaxID=3347082 RepID=UPI0036624732
MGYPHGPQQGYDPYAGQPRPGAMPYGSQPGYGAQPYAGPEYSVGAQASGAAPYPGYATSGPGGPRANGGTAITAAVIALLVSLGGLTIMGIAAAVILFSEPSSASEDEFRSTLTIVIVIGALPALLLLIGAYLLFRRKTAGRVILILVSSLTLLYIVFNAVTSPMDVEGQEIAFALLGVVIIGSVPLVILLLAAAPSTGRWIRAGRPGGHPPHGY